jgi:tRNA(fMet)-specific endonuclease VapC
VPILDTDTLTIIQRREEPYYTRLLNRLRLLPVNTPVWVTIVSFEEQLRGWLEYVKRAKPPQLPRAYAKLHELHQDFNTRPVLMFDSKAAEIFAKLKGRIHVNAADLKIAALTMAKEELLLSKNLRDFRRVPDLQVEDWTV